jgi:hypothetical protein
MARPDLRIPVFDDYIVFNIGNAVEIDSDIPIPEWMSGDWKPPEGRLEAGKAAKLEVFRLTTFKTCPFCRTAMTRVCEGEQPGILLVCESCNYWGGRGTREWGAGAADNRGTLGRYQFIKDAEAVPMDGLLRHFNNHPKDLYSLSPFKAEEMVIAIIKEALDCDARLIGGVKDNGVDGVIVKNDSISTVIQIKWRESSLKTESVSVVREVAGTLLARGVPKAMIVSTASRFTKDAKAEAEGISQRIVTDVGQIELDLKAYDELVGMLGVATRKINDGRDPKTIITDYQADCCLFDA